ncbi:acetolactate synthase small subunit [Lentisphaerota bacterium WC36G]|nr:acetolactate synthase small subunit [Lentisphaerae bacterium WC36]
MEEHTISVLVENNFGVLSRVAGLFSGRGYNICSLTVSPTHDPKISKMTIVTKGDDAIIEQIDKQLNKLVEVIAVTDLTGVDFIEREMIVLKVKTTKENRSDIVQLVELFDGKILTVHAEELGVELSGTPKQIDNFIELIRDYGIIDIARSGRIAISENEGKA